jgi:serine/threonine-protein kinase
MPLLTPGQTVRDTYEVERFLGQGAFAEVYRVKHQFLGRQAMKVFKRVGITQKETMEMLGEAILLSRIGHPNIVRVFDANVFDSENGRCGYFTMENIPGGSLDKFWNSHGAKRVPIETTIDLVKQVCRGLVVAHLETPPIIHRDIKPQNILVGYEADGLRARISDFGLAKSVNPLTLMATSAGTLAFKPPEAFASAKGDSCAGDIWGLGTTLYLLLTDQLPVDVDPELGWSKGQVSDSNIVSPGTFNFDVDEHLDQIVLKCLQKKPEDRFKNARELLDELERWKPVPYETTKLPRKKEVPVAKVNIGIYPKPSREEARELARQAIRIAKEDGVLMDAADLMEEAFNKSPSLRQKYASQVRLWRCGISM